MASPGLGPLLALGLPLLPVRWGRAWGQTPDPTVNGNHTITTPGPGSHSSGALPCSWLWGWPCWCGSYGRNGRQRAPTGPAVRSSSPTQLRPRPPRTQRRRCGAACPSRSPSSLHLLCLLCDLGGRWSPLWAIKPT
ncbi:protein crumbs homolog 3 isoform X1 [Manis pentadactyla]|uniref:protein crumbs homolog 3 isoform X1 n=1 Tax=Manis pentadactyla TaxID=143292 RepID=UPI00255C4E76|nr:protein crumbs homolog 3 isoform X1 [Manis pentadactyla]